MFCHWWKPCTRRRRWGEHRASWGWSSFGRTSRTLRGWYAAPVGWIDCNMEGAFAVAIRSAVVQKERAWAYAGAGIVPDSIPKAEWEETAWKFQPIIRSVDESLLE